MAVGSADYIYHGKILRVIDGDSLEVSLDLGFNVSITETVRVYGINCAETRSKDAEEKRLGRAAKEYAQSLLPVGEVFQMQTVKADEKFGRWLASITLHDGTDFATKMVTDGFAEEYFGGRRR